MQYSNLQSYNISPIYKLDGQTPLRSCLFLLLTIPFILRVLKKKKKPNAKFQNNKNENN